MLPENSIHFYYPKQFVAQERFNKLTLKFRMSNQIGLQTADISIPKAVKITPFCYFNHSIIVFSPFSIEISTF